VKRNDFASIGIALVAISFGACNKADQVRSALEADQGTWNKHTATLKSRASDLEQRFKSLPAQAADAPAKSIAQRRRVEALVAGAQQSLAGLDRNIEENARQVQAAADRDPNNGEQLLASAVHAIDGYFQQQEQNVVTAETALSQLGEER
jgi:hypothetical protein